MRNLEARIKKLEKQESPNIEEIYAILDESKLDVFERTRILVDTGLITGEMIAGWIKNGSRKLKEKDNGK